MCAGGALNRGGKSPFWDGKLPPASCAVALFSVSFWPHSEGTPCYPAPTLLITIMSTSSSPVFSVFLFLPTHFPPSEFHLCIFLCYFLLPTMTSFQSCHHLKLSSLPDSLHNLLPSLHTLVSSKLHLHLNQHLMLYTYFS